MSAAVICDECGRIVKRYDVLHCAKAKTHETDWSTARTSVIPACNCSTKASVLTDGI